MTNFDATSRLAIRPSGETFDLVIPGIFKVVAGGRIRGVVDPEPCRIGGLKVVSKVLYRLYSHNIFDIHNKVLYMHKLYYYR
jgi:hypothetical protein